MKRENLGIIAIVIYLFRNVFKFLFWVIMVVVFYFLCIMLGVPI